MATTQPGALDTATNLFMVENRASTTLDGDIADDAMELDVTNGAVFPAAGRFVITIDDEILIIESRATHTLTIEERGAEGTDAAAHSDDVTVGQQFTAGLYETLRDAIIATQEGAMRRGSVAAEAPGPIQYGVQPGPAAREAVALFWTRRFSL